MKGEHPGVVFVVDSSRTQRTVDVCKRPVNGVTPAPRVSHVKRRKTMFRGGCYYGSVSNPDHTTVLANGRDRGGNFVEGKGGKFSNSRRALPGVLRTGNCRATVVNG